ncbi:MAG: PorT family protein [Chitinophagaceae bacterium]|nr:PorT family protein [Chitinophagaceae bacterium]
MKKTLLLLLGITGALLIQAQSSNPTNSKKDWSKLDLSSRPADHFMIQYGSDAWTGRPDSVRTGGFSRHFNIYFMMDKPFKTNPHYSLGIGAGLGTSNMFFKNTDVNIKAQTPKLPFTNVDSADHFKKFKLATIYLEIPVELRYYSNPENPMKSWKYAIGAKVGTLLKSYTKGKNLVNKTGTSYYGSNYVQKDQMKRFMNGTSLALTGRIGYGIVSVDAAYYILGVLKDGTGPVMNKVSFGITISGL